MRKQLVGLEEMASILGTNTRHLYALVERGALPRVKVGRLLRFDPDAVVNHLSKPAIKAGQRRG